MAATCLVGRGGGWWCTVGDWPNSYACEWSCCCGRGAAFLLGQLVEASAIPKGVGQSELSSLISESVYRTWSVELFFGAAECASTVAWLPCSPFSSLSLGLVFWGASSLWSV